MKTIVRIIITEPRVLVLAGCIVSDMCVCIYVCICLVYACLLSIHTVRHASVVCLCNIWSYIQLMERTSWWTKTNQKTSSVSQIVSMSKLLKVQ